MSFPVSFTLLTLQLTGRKLIGNHLDYELLSLFVREGVTKKQQGFELGRKAVQCVVLLAWLVFKLIFAGFRSASQAEQDFGNSCWHLENFAAFFRT